MSHFNEYSLVGECGLCGGSWGFNGGLLVGGVGGLGGFYGFVGRRIMVLGGVQIA